MIPRLFGLFVLASALSAQQEPDGRAFMPLQPKSEVRVDFASMRDSELWDGIRRSLASTLLPLLEDQLGFRLAEVDHLRAYPLTGKQEPGLNTTGVVVFEGSDHVIAPSGRIGTRSEDIDGFEVVVEEDSWDPSDPCVWVAPRAGVLVYGSSHCVLPVLRAERQGGVVPPELLSLSAGRGVMAHYVMEMAEVDARLVLDMLAAPESVAPEFLMMRLRQGLSVGDAESEVHLEATLRWAVGTEGPMAMRDHLQERLVALRQHPRLGALRRWWDAIELTVDGRDLRAHIGLGRPRQAGGMIALLLPFMMFTRVTAAEQPVVEEVEAVPARRNGQGSSGSGGS